MSSYEPKIYLLPNMMTAGNLFCGFAAVLKIIEASLLNAAGESVVMRYHVAIAFILGACVFDLLDGRLARLGGHESPFGREFDSLADMVSFGLAPALLVYQIVLQDFHRTGWIIAFVYLLCGALRLARFNCVAEASKRQEPEEESSSEFYGFPIPAAAGLIASLTLLMLWFDQGERTIGRWKFVLPPVLLFLSFMMFSRVKYPSFKGLNWRSQRSIPRFLIIILILIFTAMNYEWMPAVLFLTFLLYGFVRPFLSKPLRDEIEEEDIEEKERASPDISC
ncbi:MAG: CDP-diacylglycerol--serine O-phosphatidyltransferase [Verrucomicrobia bacterium]|jgi:CDP-diacylglycerol--serine O-phosphatidyltransferase|nr:MAG: CDP-diacylglycerol--serine O-phosphatidyltransferase [Verrucomicrobiota bacterium]